MQEIKKILVTKEGQFFYVKDITKDYHTQFGLVSVKELSKESGSKVLTNTGVEMSLLDAQFIDKYFRIKRGAQLITRKDIGLIITETGIGKDSVCVDCGGGSGGLSCYLAFLCKKVTVYDNRGEHLKVVSGNMDFLGLKNYETKLQDVYEGIDEKDVDLVTIDVTEPWKVLEHALKALKPGGFVVSYSPSVTQSVNTVNQAEDLGLVHLRTTEILERNWDIRGRVAHPKFRDINHTGFVSVFRVR